VAERIEGRRKESKKKERRWNNIIRLVTKFWSLE